MEVTNREVIYKSNIYFTPLTRDDEIDSEQVAYIISMEYENAGMTPDMLGSGAVIITGESAKKNKRPYGDGIYCRVGRRVCGCVSGSGSGKSAARQRIRSSIESE